MYLLIQFHPVLVKICIWLIETTVVDYRMLLSLFLFSYLIQTLRVAVQNCEVYQLESLIWCEWKFNQEVSAPESDVTRSAREKMYHSVGVVQLQKHSVHSDCSVVLQGRGSSHINTLCLGTDSSLTLIGLLIEWAFSSDSWYDPSF